MKTKNKTIQKFLKMSSFTTLILLISLNTFSQKAFNTISLNDIKNSIYHDSKADILNAFSLSYDLVSEEVMIEDWMKNPFEWIESSAPDFLAVPENFPDEEIEIEEWMIDPGWDVIITEEIELENWMVTPGCWIIKNDLVKEAWELQDNI